MARFFTGELHLGGRIVLRSTIMAHDPDSADNIISSFNFKLLHRFFWFTVYFNCFYFFIDRSSPSEVFLGKGVLKICSKLTGEHPCQSVISITLQSNFIEIALRHGFSSGNFRHIFRTSFSQNNSGRLLLYKTNENLYLLSVVNLRQSFSYSK